MNQPIRVGLVGCGTISETYLRAPYPSLRYVACADLDPARAEATASAHGMRALSPEQLWSDEDIDVVCNLTVPRAHGEVSLACLEAGKHVYQEKPLALDRGQAATMLETARARGLLLACAPDTFLGAGLQTCRRLIDEGVIGRPIAATAQMANHGHEHWHPDPAFYYARGGGPLFDMGPYYLTALVSLLGPIRRVAAFAAGSGAARLVRQGKRAGQLLAVEVPTHISGVLDLAGGVVASLVMSFDTWSSPPALLEIHGDEASLALPDPNTFGGPVRLFLAGTHAWREVPIDDFEQHQRGVGLADLAAAISTGTPVKTSAELAFHVLDAMAALVESAETGRVLELTSTSERPEPMARRVR